MVKQLDDIFNRLSTAENQNVFYLATLTSSFNNFIFDGVVLERYYGSQIIVTRRGFEMHAMQLPNPLGQKSVSLCPQGYDL